MPENNPTPTGRQPRGGPTPPTHTVGRMSPPHKLSSLLRAFALCIAFLLPQGCRTTEPPWNGERGDLTSIDGIQEGEPATTRSLSHQEVREILRRRPFIFSENSVITIPTGREPAIICKTNSGKWELLLGSRLDDGVIGKPDKRFPLKVSISEDGRTMEARGSDLLYGRAYLKITVQDAVNPDMPGIFTMTCSLSYKPSLFVKLLALSRGIDAVRALDQISFQDIQTINIPSMGLPDDTLKIIETRSPLMNTRLLPWFLHGLPFAPFIVDLRSSYIPVEGRQKDELLIHFSSLETPLPVYLTTEDTVAEEVKLVGISNDQEWALISKRTRGLPPEEKLFIAPLSAVVGPKVTLPELLKEYLTQNPSYLERLREIFGDQSQNGFNPTTSNEAPSKPPHRSETRSTPMRQPKQHFRKGKPIVKQKILKQNRYR